MITFNIVSFAQTENWGKDLVFFFVRQFNKTWLWVGIWERNRKLTAVAYLFSIKSSENQNIMFNSNTIWLWLLSFNLIFHRNLYVALKINLHFSRRCSTVSSNWANNLTPEKQFRSGWISTSKELFVHERNEPKLISIKSKLMK